MNSGRGLDQIPAQLTPNQARILNAHIQLKRALEAVEIPDSGRWTKSETAISVLEALEAYLCDTLDHDCQAGEITITRQSDQRAVLQDIIRHFKQVKWGKEDARLAADKSGDEGSSHDQAMVQFKLYATALVNGIAENLKLKGVKNYKAEARKLVVDEYRRLGLKFQTRASRAPEDIDELLLESWEKRSKPHSARPNK